MKGRPAMIGTAELFPKENTVRSVAEYINEKRPDLVNLEIIQIFTPLHPGDKWYALYKWPGD